LEYESLPMIKQPDYVLSLR